MSGIPTFILIVPLNLTKKQPSYYLGYATLVSNEFPFSSTCLIVSSFITNAPVLIIFLNISIFSALMTLRTSFKSNLSSGKSSSILQSS